jgi:hypothetical protein
VGTVGPVEVKSPATKTFEKNGGGSLGCRPVVQHMPKMQ